MSLKGRTCFSQAKVYTKVLSFLLCVLNSKLSSAVLVMAKSSLFLSRSDGDQTLNFSSESFESFKQGKSCQFRELASKLLGVLEGR